MNYLVVQQRGAHVFLRLRLEVVHLHTNSATLQQVTGVERDTRRVSDLAFHSFEHGYPPELLARIASQARELADREREAQDGNRFLRVRHLREAQNHIPEVGQLMRDPARLARLSELAGTTVGPYPMTRAAAHINFYRPGEVPIDFHTDGAALVELIPLYTSGTTGGGGTIVYRGEAGSGLTRLADGDTFGGDELQHVPQSVGRSVLMQGRMLLHSAESFDDGERVTLVFALEAVSQPWQDDNTLTRLLLDDPLDRVLDEWVAQAQRRVALYTQTQAHQPSELATTNGASSS